VYEQLKQQEEDNTSLNEEPNKVIKVTD